MGHDAARQAGCDGKFRFPDYFRAEEIAQQMRRRRKRKRRIQSYRCAWCGFWHVGTAFRPHKLRRETEVEDRSDDDLLTD